MFSYCATFTGLVHYKETFLAIAAPQMLHYSLTNEKCYPTSTFGRSRIHLLQDSALGGPSPVY